MGAKRYLAGVGCLVRHSPIHRGGQHVGASARRAMRLYKTRLGQCLQRAFGKGRIPLDAVGQLLHSQALALTQRTQRKESGRQVAVA